MNKVKRISVIGGSGTGKTTLSDNLSKVLNIPVYHLDGIHYLENWKIRDKQERDKIIIKHIKENSWIIDGTYRSTLDMRLKVCDLAIFLDFSTLTRLRGILKRFMKHHGEEKEDIPGCKERISWEFFWLIFKWKKTKRKEIIKLLNNIDDNKILIFKNRKTLNRWYEQEFKQKMVIK